MSNIAILTDSTAGLSPQIIERENLIVVPCQVSIGQKTYREGVDLTAEQLFDRIFGSDETPSTSMPAGEDYAAAFAEIQARQATGVLGIFVGSGFSGTFNGARIAAQEQPIPVELVDSGTTSLALGLLVLHAARMARSGHALEEIATEVRGLSEQAELYALLDTLEFIRRGGRIGRVGELVATFLNIKPVLRLTHNSADVVARTRSRKRGIAWLLNTAQEAAPVRSIGVIHTGAVEAATDLAEQLRPFAHPDQEILIQPAGAAVAAHAGPDAIGFGMIR